MLICKKKKKTTVVSKQFIYLCLVIHFYQRTGLAYDITGTSPVDVAYRVVAVVLPPHGWLILLHDSAPPAEATTSEGAAMTDPKKPYIIALEEHYWDPEVAEVFDGQEGRAGPLRLRLDDLGDLRIKEMDEAGKIGRAHV